MFSTSEAWSRAASTESEAADQFAGAFIADAFGAGDIVDGIAHQGHDVGDLRGRDAHDFFDLGGVEYDIGLGGALAGTQDANTAADQLHHVFVAGDDVDVDVAAAGLLGERADDVVGFVAGNLDDGQAHGFAEAAHKGNLNEKIVGHGRPLGFVLGEKLVAEGGAGGIENDGDKIGLQILGDAAKHVGKKEGDFGGDALILQAVHGGKEGAKNEAHGVDQEEFFRGFGGHRRSIAERCRANVRGETGDGGRRRRLAEG